jgi:hypothetical protein
MLDNVKETMTTFAKRVKQQARTNLTKGKHNVSGDLYNSVDYELIISKNSYSLSFWMEDYAEFQDKGVSGTQRKYNTPYSYKSNSNLLGFELATGTFARWAKFKGIRFRSSGGKFAKGNYKSIGVAIALAKKKKGIKPTHFFTKSLESGFKTLPQDIVESFALNLDNIITDKDE